jgi:hypothetical protein
MIRKFLNLINGQSQVEKQIDHYRSLMRKEAELGGQVFGPVQANHRREFFCLDKNTWIWHEEWNDASGTRQSRTTRYDVRPDGILKAQNNGTYHALSREEAVNLIEASRIYRSRVLSGLYGVAA